MVDDVATRRRARGSDWIIVRIDPANGAETYYMAGNWVRSARFAKRIRGYGNALEVKEKILKDSAFIYEIRPVD
jgi:ABC-type phosphonate transport system ATPase subunit